MKTEYLDSTKKQFEYYKMLGEQAIKQIPDNALSWRYNQESNSIAVIVHHITGNMLSRFTDFLTTDGEKTWRNREAEFEDVFTDRDSLLSQWDRGWNCLFTALNELKPEQLENIVYIRNGGHTVVEALNRQLTHYAYHIGQIVFIAKMAANDKWESLSIPRNTSNDYNSNKFAQEKARRHFTEDL